MRLSARLEVESLRMNRPGFSRQSPSSFGLSLHQVPANPPVRPTWSCSLSGSQGEDTSTYVDVYKLRIGHTAAKSVGKDLIEEDIPCRELWCKKFAGASPRTFPLTPLQPTDLLSVMRAGKFFQCSLLMPTVTYPRPSRLTRSPQRHALERVTVDLTFEHLRLISQTQPTPRNPSKLSIHALTRKHLAAILFFNAPALPTKKSTFTGQTQLQARRPSSTRLSRIRKIRADLL